MNSLLAAINYALAGMNVYFWQEGGEYAFINLSAAIFTFGIGILLSVQK